MHVHVCFGVCCLGGLLLMQVCVFVRGVESCSSVVARALAVGLFIALTFSILIHTVHVGVCFCRAEPGGG